MKTPQQIRELIEDMRANEFEPAPSCLKVLEWVLSGGDEALCELELYAWVGEDELGSGEIGIKQGMVAAGMIPLCAIKKEKMAKLKDRMQLQSDTWGKKISLVRFVFAEVVDET